MWSGTGVTLPSNWKFCDGTNGTPDLRGRFVLGTNYQLDNSLLSIGPLNQWVARNATGGSPNAVVVTHSHGITDPGHRHGYPTGTDAFMINTYSPVLSLNSNQQSLLTNTQSTGITINSEGVSGTDKNLPPYYVLAYIMRVS